MKVPSDLDSSWSHHVVLEGQWKVLQSCLPMRKVLWDGLISGFWCTGHFFSRLVQELNGSSKPSSDSACACFLRRI